MPTPRPSPDLAELLPSWELHLRAERKSPATLRVYVGGARHFLGWCERIGTQAQLDRATVTAYIADLLDRGAEGNSAKIRQQALRRFAAWLVEEGELDADPLAGLKPPRVDSKVTPVLSAQQLRALLAACQGPTFTHRRDEALVRLMAETGLRAGEAVGLAVDDVDVRAGTAVVRRGKGGKGRMVPFGPQTARALDRYLRLRRTHRLADTPALWLGARSKTLGYSGLHQALGIRAAQAGIAGFHPHVLRHTAAHRWLAAGGTEGGLMAVAGWSRRDMLDRYAAATAAERAADEARRLGLGDL
jgi:site-specific recombinase XerD